MADATADFSGLTNPKRVIEKRMAEAESESPDPKKGVDKGDLPGPHIDFFKPRDRSKDAAGLAKALKNRK